MNIPIAQQVKSLREKQGLTQAQLAKKSEVSFATINRIENEWGSVTMGTLNKIATALGAKLVVTLEK